MWSTLYILHKQEKYDSGNLQIFLIEMLAGVLALATSESIAVAKDVMWVYNFLNYVMFACQVLRADVTFSVRNKLLPDICGLNRPSCCVLLKEETLELGNRWRLCVASAQCTCSND